MKYLFLLLFSFIGTAASAQTVSEYVAPATNSDTTLFQYVEQMPEPSFNMNEYLAKNMKYPKEAVQNNIEGKVYVRFVVNTDGSISNPEIAGRRVANGELLEKESISVIKNMPKWKPGKQNGQPVRVSYIQPLTWMLH